MEKARKEAGLTQQEVAARLNVCRQTYRRYEQSPETMPLGTAIRFAGIVGCPAVAVLHF